MLIDVTTFTLSPGADESKFLEADHQLQEAISSAAGFVRRTTARSDSGWLVITIWFDESAMATAVERPATAAALAHFNALVDAVESRSFTALDG